MDPDYFNILREFTSVCENLPNIPKPSPKTKKEGPTEYAWPDKSTTEEKIRDASKIYNNAYHRRDFEQIITEGDKAKAQGQTMDEALEKVARQFKLRESTELIKRAWHRGGVFRP